MKPWKLMVLRLLIACLFGFVVTGLALSAGRRQAEVSLMYAPQFQTQRFQSIIVQAVDAYEKKTHALPSSLKQIGVDYLNDGWGRPFVYIVQGKKYRVVSYGQDGKPGGTGTDTHISSDKPLPEPVARPNNHQEGELTLQDFLRNPFMQDIVRSAYGTGALAAVLCFVTVRPKVFTRRSLLSLAIQVVATLAAAAWVATIITALHIPVGH